MNTLKLHARIHEMRCSECRITWFGWVRRIINGTEDA